ncbi:hypothetical protein R1flu_005912 [Riccia fluitans]|uniref:Uncharacterized protein n=1 Tax=Riccia fluitans TaxID=41844 RepID=A0ABD1YV87_9MARC
MSHAVETTWWEQVERLIIWQQKENKVDHEWRVRTWDKGECAVGVFECLECQCCLGRPDRGEEKVAVQNVFINYRNKHIGCEKHVANWRRCCNLPLNVDEKKTLEPQVNHHAEIDAACAIVEKVNGEELSQKKPFIVEGDVKCEPCYSWIFKDSNFKEVAKILTATKALHGITRDVAVILAEDETWVKPTLSDGDARRRKLMFEDYLGSEGQRWTVGWDGWVLSDIVLDSGDVYALGD